MASQTMVVPTSSGPPNIWQKALETLDDDLKRTLNFPTSRKIDVLAAVLKTANEKRKICLEKQWRFKKPNGEHIILRDILEKIIAWAERFKDIGDIAVQYNTGHASLPWAGVRFLLQVAVGDKQYFGAMIERLEQISHLIPRYALVEALYLQRDTSLRSELEATLTSLYAEVLMFLAKAKKYFDTSTPVRIAKSITNAFNSDVDHQMQMIAKCEDNVSKLALLFDTEFQQDTGKAVAVLHNLLVDLNKPIARLIDQATTYTKVLQESEHLEVLRWLSSTPFSLHHRLVSENRITGSGQWLLNHDQYLCWKSSSSSSILLLHGILGSGKTSLTSTVVDSYLEDNRVHASLAPLAYFYCAKNSFEPGRSDPNEILRSITRQLTFFNTGQSRVHHTIAAKYNKREAQAKLDGFEKPRLCIVECVNIILEVTASNPAVIIIDALDEVQESCRHELLNALMQITKNSASVVKVLLTTRDNSNIFALLPGASKITYPEQKQ